MQPLKVIVNPSSESTVGWEACSERSMIFNRLKERASGPLAQTPLPSGPLLVMVAPFLATNSMSASSPTRTSLARRTSLALQYQGVFEAPSGRRVDDAGPGVRNSRQAPGHYVARRREHERPQVHVRLGRPAAVGHVDQVGGEVHGFLDHEGGRVHLYAPSGVLQGLLVCLGAYHEALPPVALPGLEDQLVEPVEHLFSVFGFRGRERGDVLEDRLFFEVALYHGRHIGEDGLVVGDAHANCVNEVDPACEVDLFELGEVGLHVVLVEAAVDHVYPPPVGAVPDLAALHVTVGERQELEAARLRRAAVLEVRRVVLAAGHDHDAGLLDAGGRGDFEGLAEHGVVFEDPTYLVGIVQVTQCLQPGPPDGLRVGAAARYPHVVLEDHIIAGFELYNGWAVDADGEREGEIGQRMGPVEDVAIYNLTRNHV